MAMANNIVLVTYEGQPQTCYGCNNRGQQLQECPTRKQNETRQTKTTPTAWTNIIKKRQVTNQPEEERPRNIQMQEEDEDEENEEGQQQDPFNEEHNREQTMETTNDIDHQQGRKEGAMKTGIASPQKTGGGKDDEEQTNMIEDKKERENKTTATLSTSHGQHNEQDVEMNAEKETGKGRQQKELKVRDGTYISLTPDTEAMKHRTQTSPKRPKKQRLERDTEMTRDRTRSRDGQRKTQKL
jgi:hypothetical protein